MELHESQGDQLDSQPEENLIRSGDEGTVSAAEIQRDIELIEQCEKSSVDEKIGECERIETQNDVEISGLLPVEVPSNCDTKVSLGTEDPSIAFQDTGFNSGLHHHLPNASQGLPDHSEMFADIIKTVHELKCSNYRLEKVLGENCHVITELESKCAALEKKNEGLEKVVAKLIVTGDSSATDLVRLSTEVAGLVAAKSNGSSMTDQKTGEKISSDTEKQVSPNTIPLPTVEQRIADLELLTVESSTRLKELAISVDHIERDLQRFIRRHSIIVENLCPKEDRSAQEAFLVFVNCVLHVSADESDIDGLHLIDKQSTDASAGTGSPGKTANEHLPRAVLVTFTCYRTRMQVYKAWLSYRVGASGDAKAGVGALSGERGQGVCIREYLTAAQELVYRAAMDARHRKPDLITDCWTFRGRAFVRTCHGDVREFSEVDQMITKNDSKYRSCSVM